MNCAQSTLKKIRIFLVIFYSLSGLSAWSDDQINPKIPTEPPPPAEGFLLMKTSPKEKSDTYHYLSNQDDPNTNRDKNIKNYESGKSRAQQMVGMLQNKELTKAFEKITESGNKTLNENSEIKTPLAIIAGAASFWYGQTVKLIRGNDFNFSARLEGKAQRSEFSMGSPLLNGRLKFDAKEGMDLGVNRSISTLQADAAVQYNARNQVFSTEVRKKIAPNLDLSFGASRLDQNTKVEYRLNF